MATKMMVSTSEIAEILGLGTARTSKILRDGRIPTAELVEGRWQAERSAVVAFAKTYVYMGTSKAAPKGHPATVARPKAAPKAAAKAPAKAAPRAAAKAAPKAAAKAAPAERAGTQTAQRRARR